MAVYTGLIDKLKVTDDELAELVAAALQENGRALVLGQRSYGKGSVQTVMSLGADKGAGRAYQLLCEAMAKTGRCAIGRFSNRGRQQLVVLRQVDGVLVLHGLFYSNEVRDRTEIDHGDGTPAKDAELDLAMKLVDALAVVQEVRMLHQAAQEEAGA